MQVEWRVSTKDSPMNPLILWFIWSLHGYQFIRNCRKCDVIPSLCQVRKQTELSFICWQNYQMKDQKQCISKYTIWKLLEWFYEWNTLQIIWLGEKLTWYIINFHRQEKEYDIFNSWLIVSVILLHCWNILNITFCHFISPTWRDHHRCLDMVASFTRAVD